MKLHVYLFVIPLLFCFFIALDTLYAKSEKNQGGEIEAYFDFSDKINHMETMMSVPGKNWKTCIEPACEKTGWLTEDAKIIDHKKGRASRPALHPVTGELLINEHTNEPLFNTYLKVKVEYTYKDANGKDLKKVAEGWIDEDYIRYKKKEEEKVMPFYESKPTKIKIPNIKNGSLTSPLQDCRPKIIDTMASGVDDLAKITDKAQEPIELNKKIADETEIISQHIGACAKPSDQSISANLSENSYDSYILDSFKNTPVPDLKKEILINDKIIEKKMTKQDLIDIDAIARTLYGEVAECFKKGLNYPITVARVIKNRIQFPGNSFIEGSHSERKADLSKIATTPSQFHTWRRQHTSKKTGITIANPALKHALCPPPYVSPAEQDARNSEKKKKLPYGYDIWKNAVRIATETVLYGDTKFKNRTGSVSEQTLFFTSYLDFQKKRATAKQVRPVIEGRTLEPDPEKACVSAYEDKTIVNKTNPPRTAEAKELDRYWAYELHPRSIPKF